MTTSIYTDKTGRRNAMIEPMPQRFWKHVRRGDASQCWEFDIVRGDGYGCITIKGKQSSAHRVSWELHNGPIPAGLCVLHKCDNPPCVNPAHLFLGTKSDNSRDAVRKGRQVIPNVSRKPMFKTPPTQKWLDAHKDDDEPEIIGPSVSVEHVEQEKEKSLEEKET